MRTFWMGLGAMCVLSGCGASAHPPAAGTPKPPALAATGKPTPRPDLPVLPENAAATQTWIHAAAESDALLASSHETYLGVWIDAPNARPRVRAPLDLALVIDTSGSMEGDKIRSAHDAARTLVSNLSDGDIVSIDTFSDSATILVPPTRINETSRAGVLRAVDSLEVGGSTDMYDGLALGEQHLATGPETNPVRRLVMISDGIANVGPSTPSELGELAEHGLRMHAQVTSLGVGTDYDEHTLNALAVRSSGRLFHIGDPREMVATLTHELDLLGSSLASDAVIEIVPAPGVQLEQPEFVRSEWGPNGTIRIPVGTLFSGQRREALLKARFTEGAPRTLASVRLLFRDPAEGGVERVQEAIAHADVTDDPSVVATRANSRTRAILAVQEAGRAEIAAAQQLGQGQFQAADDRLAEQEKKLKDEAAQSRDGEEQRRLSAAAAGIAHARAAVQAAPAAPAATQRNDALEMNSAGMRDNGF
jgi:Ca-activated chloride channel family protein